LDPESPGPAELLGDLLPEPEPFPWRLWAIAGITLLTALALTGWFLQRRAQQLGAKPMSPRVAPHVRALERLEQLRRQHPQSAQEIDEYYVEASSLVREYIEERFEVRAPRMTTEEFLQARQTMKILEDSHRALLADFLVQCDLVKFGRHVPTAAVQEKLLDAAASFLQETRAHHATEPAGAGSPAESGSS
jgi:hypothetical protein